MALVADGHAKTLCKSVNIHVLRSHMLLRGINWCAGRARVFHFIALLLTGYSTVVVYMALFYRITQEPPEVGPRTVYIMLTFEKSELTKLLSNIEALFETSVGRNHSFEFRIKSC